MRIYLDLLPANVLSSDWLVVEFAAKLKLLLSPQWKVVTTTVYVNFISN